MDNFKDFEDISYFWVENKIFFSTMDLLEKFKLPIGTKLIDNSETLTANIFNRMETKCLELVSKAGAYELLLSGCDKDTVNRFLKWVANLQKANQIGQRRKITSVDVYGNVIDVKFGNTVEKWVDGIKLDKFRVLSHAIESSDGLILDCLSEWYGKENDPDFNYLYGLVSKDFADRNQRKEFYYQELFKEKSEKLGYGKIIEYRNDGFNKPDAWVEKNGEKIPVEVKLNDFDGKALNQLLRYMTVYKAKNGIAVGRNLKVGIPPNIMFVRTDDLIKA